MEYSITEDNVLLIKKGGWYPTSVARTAFQKAKERYGRDIWVHDEKFDKIVKVVVSDEITRIDEEVFRDFASLEEIELPKGLTEISKKLFSNCRNLKYINIPDSVSSIGEDSFDGCRSLESIVIPSKCGEIPKSAFSGCNSLKKIEFAPGRTTLPTITKRYYLENSAFENVEEVIIPEGVTDIPSEVFMNFYNLKTINLPSTLQNMGNHVFENCRSLQQITIPSGVSVIPQHAFASCTSLKSVSISEGVETIEDGAFKDCTDLEEIELPSTIKRISTVKDDSYDPLLSSNKTIGAFENCTSLKSVTIPEGVEEIDVNTFRDCTNLEVVVLPSSLKRIKAGAFSNCKKLKTIVWPKNACIESIESGAFQSCESLEELELPDSITNLGRGCFSNCTSLKKIKLPNQLSYLGYETFSNCTSLEDITLPDSVFQIPDSCFSNCSKLKKVKLPSSLRNIGRFVFSGCSSLLEIDVPDGVTEIDDGAFENCKSLSRVRLSERIRKLGQMSFGNCTSLDTINFPDSLEDELNAFVGCKKEIIKSIPIRFKCDKNGVYYGFEKEDVCDGELIIPEGTKRIKKIAYMWQGHSRYMNTGEPKITKVEIPDDVLEIEDGAIENLRDLRFLSMPDSIIQLGKNNFSGCHNLQMLRLSRALKTLDISILQNLQASALSCIVIPDSVTSFTGDTEKFSERRAPGRYKRDFVFYSSSLSNGVAYETDTEKSTYASYSITGSSVDKNLSIFGRANEKGSTKIKSPSKVIGMYTYKDLDERTILPIEAKYGKMIGAFAFSQCPNLETVVIEEGIEEIGPGAFAECPKLKSVIIPKSVKNISEFAFCGCEALESIEIYRESMDSIGDFAFAGCKSLSEVVLPKRVGRIGDNAFYDCSTLTEVRGVEDVEEIGNEAFANCGLLQVMLPEKVRIIGYWTFNGAGIEIQRKKTKPMPITLPRELRKLDEGAFMFSGVTGVTISDGIRISTIPESSFEQCEFLTEASIPYGITSISAKAFKNCGILEEMKIPETVNSIGDESFAYCPNLSVVELYNPEKREGLHTPSTFEGSETYIRYAYDGVLTPQKPPQRNSFSLGNFIRKLGFGGR